MVVDCDVHHGNGTAGIFAGDSSVYTLSIHQFNNYPSEKPLSSMDIHLDDGVGDAEYLSRLSNGMNAAFTVFHPELVVYVAGADPYQEDQLGGLCLTLEGLAKRDRMVIDLSLARAGAVAIVLAGGYAANVADTIHIQAGTAKIAKAAMDERQPGKA
jgi:acetoin utilization deacetylase AcuC-like enzyme